MPGWVQEAIKEYQKRIQSELKFNLIEVPLPKRNKSQNIQQCIKKEGEQILKLVLPGRRIIALDISGISLSTQQLVKKLNIFREKGQNISLLIGGPDGLSQSCFDQSMERWSLSSLTLPHSLVRILVIEQLSRAVSILRAHPYHRD